jgi:hypothetical protein
MLQLLGCTQTVQLWHGNVQDHGIRPVLGGKPQQISTVARDRQDLKFWFQEILAGFRQKRVVICNQQPGPVTILHARCPNPRRQCLGEKRRFSCPYTTWNYSIETTIKSNCH